MAEKKKLASKIEFDYKGAHYVLGYTRRTLVRLTRDLKIEGVDLQQVLEHGVPEGDALLGYLIIEVMFEAAFYANHPNVSRETKDEIFTKINDKEDLAGKLFEIAAAPINALADEDEQGEISWTAGE